MKDEPGTDTTEPISSMATLSNSSLLLSENFSNEFRLKLMHFKCPIIKAVKCQITGADQKFNEEIESIRINNNSWKRRIYRYRRYLLTLVLLVFLSWLLLLYGAFFGSAFCGKFGIGSKIITLTSEDNEAYWNGIF